MLVVEDNATVGGILVALLREDGYRALRAWDCREAIKMARDRRPDVIALDVSLPYPDGLTALEELQTAEDTKATPKVVVAGNLLSLTSEQSEMVVEVVNKPFDIDRLLNVFRRVVGDPEKDIPARHFDSTDSHLNSW